MRRNPCGSLCVVLLGVGTLLAAVYSIEWKNSRADAELVDPGFAARIEAKQQVVERLIHGELSFREAAQQFQELDRGNPLVAATLDASFPNAAAEDRVRYQVMTWVASQANGSTATANVLARLRAELQSDASEASEPIQAIPSP